MLVECTDSFLYGVIVAYGLVATFIGGWLARDGGLGVDQRRGPF